MGSNPTRASLFWPIVASAAVKAIRQAIRHKRKAKYEDIRSLIHTAPKRPCRDTTIMGRKTAVGVVKMRKSGEMPETPGVTNYVVSRRSKPGKREGFEVVSGSLTAFVKKLKRRPGKDIYLGGGGEMARSFLQEDLLDELFIGLGPMLLGDAIPAFPGMFPQRDFKLTACKAYSNGSVALRYERMRTKTTR